MADTSSISQSFPADPIARLLVRFDRRRSRIILLRAAASGALALMAALLVVAVADRVWILNQPTRIVLSAVGYAVAAAVLLRAGGFRWLTEQVRQPEATELARMIESGEPAVRDRLLAAIELRADSNARGAFRDHLEADTGDRARRVRVEGTLPRRLAAWRIALVALLLLGFGAAVVLPQFEHLQIGRLLGRALVPVADIPRASRFSIAFAGETPHLVPRGEAVPLAVSVDTRYGPPPAVVELEIASDTGEIVRVPMHQADDGLFRGEAPMQGDGFVKAWADNADTRWHRIETRLRPAVFEVGATFLPPPYLPADWPQPPATNGAISALVGSTARLRITTDTPVGAATIELLEADGTTVHSTMPITLASPSTELRVDVPVARDGLLRVRLVAAESGFASDNEPLWGVRATPDAPPTLDGATSGDSLPAASDATLFATARAEDDVGLRHVEQQVRINEEAWRTLRTLAANGDLSAETTAVIEVASLGLLPGDAVEVRLVATDLADQVTAVSAWRWIITTDGPDKQRLHRIAVLADAVLAARQLRGDVNRFMSMELSGASDESLAAEQARLVQRQWKSAAVDSGHRLLRIAADGLVASREGRAADELAAVGLLAAAVAAGVESAEPAVAIDLDGLVLLTEELLRTEQIAVAADETRAALGETVDSLGTLARLRAAGEADDSASAGFHRRQAATAARLSSISARLNEARQQLMRQGSLPVQLDDVRRELDRTAKRHRDALQPNANDASLVAAAERLRVDLERLAPQLGELLVPAQQRIEDARLGVHRESPAAQQVRRDSGATSSLFSATAALAVRIPGDDASLRIVAADAALAGRAAQAVSSYSSRDTVAHAIATLDAGHSVEALRRTAESIAALHPVDAARDTVALAAGIDRTRDALLTTGHGTAASRALSQVMPSQSEQADAALRDIETLIAEEMEESRRVLERYAPSLETMLREAAAATDAQANRLRDGNDAAEIETAQAELEKQVAAAEAAVRADGAQQDLLTETGRERSRDADTAAEAIVQAAAKARVASETADSTTAADAQEELADTLEDVAAHYSNLETGEAQQSRTALRDREEELGIKEQLDNEYDRLERLADDEAALAEKLEQELQSDPAMQQELARLNDERIQAAAKTLEGAAEFEAAVQSELELAAEKLAETDAAEAGGDPEAIAEIARETRQLAERRVAPMATSAPKDEATLREATQSLREAADAGETPDASETAKQLREAEQQLQQAAREAAQTADQAEAEADRAGQEASEAFEAGEDFEPAYRQMERSKAEASEAARRAQESARAARSAQELAERAEEQRDLRSNAEAGVQQAMADAAAAQEAVKEQAQDAAEQLERAAATAQQLGNEAQADAAQQAAEAARQAASNEINQAQRAAEEGNPVEAGQAAGAASEALQKGAASAQAAQQAGSPSGPPNGPPGGSPSQSSSLAQAMDQMGENPGAAQKLVEQALGQQANAMRQRRAPPLPGASGIEGPSGPAPGGSPDGPQQPSAVTTPGSIAQSPLGDRPEAAGTWGALPPERIRGLLEGRRDVAPESYSDLVEAYYRALAERARASEGADQ